MAWTNVKKLPLVNKARRPRFEVHLKVYDLNNVPLVQGASFIKWHLPHSIHGEHRGRTAKCPIANHRVEYSYGKIVPVRIAIDKNNNLSECPIEFEVVQEFSTHGGVITSREEKITLGKVTLNLSEYVEESEAIIQSTGFRTRSRMPSTSATAAAAAAAAVTAAAGGRNATTPGGPGHARKRSSLSMHAPITAGEAVSPTTVHPSSKDKDSDSINNSDPSRAPSINEPAATNSGSGSGGLLPPPHLPEQHVEDGVTRRYLMHDSKINSTLKIGILMVQVDGERNFSAPALKTAPVFGGIAGMVGEANAAATSLFADPAAAEFGVHLLQDDGHDGANLNAQFSLAGAKSRDVYELQDMYRRALAASWACQPGELPADECIEDIFSGGDGFGPDGPCGPDSVLRAGDVTPRGHHHHHSSHHSLSRYTGRLGMGMRRGRGDSGGNLSGGGGLGEDEFLRPSDRRGLGQRKHTRHGSGESVMTMRGRGGAGEGGGGYSFQGGHRGSGGHRRDTSNGSIRPPSAGLRGRSESLSSLAATIEGERGRSGFKSAREVAEHEVRDDMVAWALPGSVA
ncbi:hypothetical protein VMCG_01879 [Cytospora schulzeri]|uniref:C2 NT-type domain-containing protein n=1 Tax=Cytospora schulzeri TaxID=448051 RepID=A0A423X2S4_9PEZI|nr:hypothetical protein VMCG_01879 [Valsa malicola]